MKDYRFKLSYTDTIYRERYTNAKFGDGLGLDYTLQSNEQYYRKQLNGRVTFCNEDYDFIMNAPLDERINVVIEIWEYSVWTTYLECYFYRTDCNINEDDRILSVQPIIDDNYASFLGVLDKEIDLVKLAPKITPVMLDKRPCLQLYALGTNNVSCVLSNMSWEQDCEAVTDSSDLTDSYHFAKWGNYVSAAIIGTGLPSDAPKYYVHKLGSGETLNGFSVTSGNYVLQISTYTAPGGGTRVLIAINKSNVRQWDATMPLSEWGMPITVDLTGANGNPDCKIEFANAEIYGRLISDVDSILGVPTADLLSGDMVGDNRNYSKVSPVNPGADVDIAVNAILSDTPTEYGIYEPGKYYMQPIVIGAGEFVPVLRNSWGRVSYWIAQSTALDYIDQTARKPTLLRNAYRLRDVIQKILDEYTDGILLSSQFLGGGDPLDISDPDDGFLYITPKSNILNINYSEPAQTAIITLRQILDMLRVCYRVYWNLFEYGGYLYVEHIEYYRRGGRYTGNPLVGIDLTTTINVRNGKHWDYQTNRYSYDKPQMPIRYEFGWMDTVTLPFMGQPINMLSNYVDQSRVDKFVANNFTSDIDYLMLNPSGVSKDGFVILKAAPENIISTPIPVGGENAYAVVLEYNAISPETISVVYGCANSGEIYAYDANGRRLGQLDDWTPISSGDEISTQWNLPAGTAMIVVHFTGSATFTLKEFYPSADRVLYYNWNYNGITDHWLQNGRLAFVYLTRYYQYDMPCRKYSIDGQEYNAKGVAKNKVQEVIFPTPGYIEIDKIVRTGLGDGKVRKITLNLSSKMAQATLEYDTE